MRKFDYSFLKTSIPGSLFNLSNIIFDIKGKEDIRLNENPKLFSKLKSKALIDSVKGSNAIENIGTSDTRLKEIVQNGSAPLTHNEKEMLGYKNVLSSIHEHNKDIYFDKATIKNLHSQMLDVASISNRGEFKTEPNTIVETIDGKRYVRFVPTAPKDVEESIDQLVLAYSEAIHDSEISPLLLIPCVILDFLCIHPFDDGNGRISRILTLLLMYKSGFDIGKFISIENAINENKGEYYQALQDSSLNWQENKNDYFPFINFMIQIMYMCYKKLDENVFKTIDRKLSKADRVEELLMNAYVPISKSSIRNALPDVSENTIELALSKLLNEQKIIKLGSYKDARYYRK